jgi:hypothetical protein
MSLSAGGPGGGTGGVGAGAGAGAAGAGWFAGAGRSCAADGELHAEARRASGARDFMARFTGAWG